MVLEPPKDIDKLRQFLRLVDFHRKFIPFFADVMACLNTMLRKGVTFKWTEQCNNVLKVLKSKLVKCQLCNILTKINHLNYLQMLLNTVIQASYIKKTHQRCQIQKPTSSLWLTFHVPSVDSNNNGIPQRRSGIWSTNQSKNLHFTLQEWNAH